MRSLSSQLGEQIGERVTVAGWVHRIRQVGAIAFILLRDRAGIVQLVREERLDLTPESVLRATGLVVATDRAPGGIEVHLDRVDLLARAAPDLPLPINRSLDDVGLDAILDNRILSLRNPAIRQIFTVQASILRHFADCLRARDFTEIKSSKLIGTETEGGTGMFEVSYFDTRVYLSQSPQFYKQAMAASGMERVFEIGAAYRAEKHDTARHLNEYVSLDVELAFIETEHDLMDLETDILQAIFAGIATEHGDIVAERRLNLPNDGELRRIPRIDYDEVTEILELRRGQELSPDIERRLCAWALREHGIDALYVYGFPRRKRPFYTYPVGRKTMSFDLLFRGMEITTGGRRINEYEMLVASMSRCGLDPERFADYLQIFKYGCPPHGGFAIGLERLTQLIFGLGNVKQASLFPRDRTRIAP